MSDVISTPTNSLIKQSIESREIEPKVNADGFGVSWYAHDVDDYPGHYRSIMPAWNDRNLNSLVSKIKSKCFVGHVRGATQGDVALTNCHPYWFNELIFAHNGTIYAMPQIKRKLLEYLDDETFKAIRGQTDSECFFALMLQNLKNINKPLSAQAFQDAYIKSLEQIHELEQSLNLKLLSRINIVISNGHEILACRYISDLDKACWSLYYTFGDKILSNDDALVQAPLDKRNMILVASEPLNNNRDIWKEIPVNHMLLIDKKLNITITPIRLHRQ